MHRPGHPGFRRVHSPAIKRPAVGEVALQKGAQGFVEVGHDMPGIGLLRSLVAGSGVLIPSEHFECRTPVVEGFGIGMSGCDQRVVSCHRVFEALHGAQRVGAVEAGFRVVGPQPKRPVEAVEGFVETAQVEQYVATIVFRFRIGGASGQHAIQFFQGFDEAVEPA